MDSLTNKLLNKKPVIRYVSPRSRKTIPDPSPQLQPKLDKIQEIIRTFQAISETSALLEDQIAARASEVVLELDLDNPEDFVVAQATARQFPEAAVEVPGINGLSVVTKLTFPMYQKAIGELKAHGKKVGQQNQLPIPDTGLKTDFGGKDKDRRPESNKMSQIMPPVPIPAYLIATIPMLFNMLHPLRSAYVNSKVVGHTHNIVAPSPGTPTGPGLPVNPT